MERKILLTIDGNVIAPRFDLTREILLIVLEDSGEVRREQRLLLAQGSADKLCDLALLKDVQTIVCGGMENEHYHYLRWKRIEVIDSVVGTVKDVLTRLHDNNLQTGDILRTTSGEFL